ncbi:MAG: moaE [Propionibacteriaceae bacterium]|nr:moaE [Propionibacteriaceae bacterium]
MPSKVRLAGITDAPLSVDRLVAAVSAPEIGGIGIFLGVVRSSDEGRDVQSLDYSDHPSAAAALAQCAERVAAQHDVIGVAVEHRVGHLEVGDLAVVVVAGAAHRHAALSACTQLIDDIKASVPIWKEQHFSSGASAWVGLP